MDFDLDSNKPKHNADEQRKASFAENVSAVIFSFLAFLLGVWVAIWIIFKIFELIGRF